MNQTAEQVKNKFKCYSLKVISGKELLAKDNILFEAETEEISQFIDDILVPSEKVVEIRNNKKKTKDKMFFPGYILINMTMNSKTKYIVENAELFCIYEQSNNINKLIKILEKIVEKKF